MKKKFLWWIIAGTKGGRNRGRIINELNERPYNAHQLADKLKLDYKTIRHHIEVLEKNDIVTSTKMNYGTLYFLSDRMEKNYDTFQEIWKQFEKIR